MNQEKIGEFIKKLRQEKNLTQKDLADSLGVTYQAVSKWENGKNVPDILILQQISKKFHVDINELLEGKKKSTNHQRLIIIISIVLLNVCLITGILFFHKDDFEFKTIRSNCSNFNITGSIAYNQKKSSIYISHIDYCGELENDTYTEFLSQLYEKENNTEKIIEEIHEQLDEPLKLEEYLQKLQFQIDNYPQMCHQYNENNLYLEINATTTTGKTNTFKIPLTITENCNE